MDMIKYSLVPVHAIEHVSPAVIVELSLALNILESLDVKLLVIVHVHVVSIIYNKSHDIVLY